LSGKLEFSTSHRGRFSFLTLKHELPTSPLLRISSSFGFMAQLTILSELIKLK